MFDVMPVLLFAALFAFALFKLAEAQYRSGPFWGLVTLVVCMLSSLAIKPMPVGFAAGPVMSLAFYVLGGTLGRKVD